MQNTPKAVTTPGEITAYRWVPLDLAISMYSGMTPSCVGTVIVAISHDQQRRAPEAELREREAREGAGEDHR